MLKKNLSMYERDSEGVLIPQKVSLVVSVKDLENNPELKDQSIKVIPLTRGDIKKMFNMTGKETDTKPDMSKDEDGDLIIKYCKDPEYTKEETIYLKPVYTRSIVTTILEESGIKVDKNSGEKRIDKSDEFGKN